MSKKLKSSGYGYTANEKVLYKKNKGKRVRKNNNDKNESNIHTTVEFQWLAYILMYTYGYYCANTKVMTITFILTVLALAGKSITKEEEE